MTGASQESSVPIRQTANLPAELRELPQWIVWRLTMRNGRRTKVPWRCDGRSRAAVDDPSTWSTLVAATEAAASGCGDGLGFVFTASDPFAGADLDDCLDDLGRLHPAAAAIVDRLDSYAELSPSGRGVHVLVRAELPEGVRHRTRAVGWPGGIEIYGRRRFFTVTGRRLTSSPATIEPRQAELDALVAELLPARPRVEAQPPRPAQPVGLDDARLLERARRARNGYGELFARLYENAGACGYGSASEADLALCGQLSFWTAGDAARIDRLFRSSARMREKWDEAGHFAVDRELTYGARTIALAVANCPNFYTPPEERRRRLLEAGSEQELEQRLRENLP